MQRMGEKIIRMILLIVIIASRIREGERNYEEERRLVRLLMSLSLSFTLVVGSLWRRSIIFYCNVPVQHVQNVSTDLYILPKRQMQR